MGGSLPAFFLLDVIALSVSAFTAATADRASGQQTTQIPPVKKIMCFSPLCVCEVLFSFKNGYKGTSVNSLTIAKLGGSREYVLYRAIKGIK